MHRNLSALTETNYDLVIIGGGIFGACAAWDATLRGLSVALIEKTDFSHATSANHLKMVHGGIRYLQHGDIYRIRESSHERSALLRIAPNLVKPLPIVIPTYRGAFKGKALLGAGMSIYDILTFDRNRGLKEGRTIPGGKFLSREQVLSLFPGINKSGLTGGAIFYDGQMYSPPRIALSFLKSASEKGLISANYVKATGFLKNGNRICGVRATNQFCGDELEIRAKVVLNTSGPWAHRLLRDCLDIHIDPEPTFSRDLALVIDKKPQSDFGIALTTESGDADSIVDRGGRHLFAAPWRDFTLIGVWHKVFEHPPEKIEVSKNELKGFTEEINQIYPSSNISTKNIVMINTGLTLFGSKNKQGKTKLSFGKRSQLIDHRRAHQLEGIITLIGVRATTARGMAAKAIDLVFKTLDSPPPKSSTAQIPLYGGNIDNFDEFLGAANQNNGEKFGSRVIDSLVHNHGTKYTDVIQYSAENTSLAETVAETNVLKAEVVYAIREEMAQKLADVIFRRTDLGTGGYPGIEAVKSCAHLMATEMGWDQTQTNSEIETVDALFQRLRNYT
jgi:glycerol-3-phosphate dehydrogenase